MKFFISLSILFSMVLLSSCGNVSDVKTKNNSLLSQAELIDSKNKSLIGTEVSDDSSLEKTKKSSKEFDNESNIKFPKNNVVKKLATTTLPPTSITNFESINNISPEVIMPNGSAALFTQKDSKGWTCKVGDRLIYEFKKYKSDVNNEQTMIIGYILNGELYPGEEVKKLEGTYQLDIKENGDYYIYIINAASDYLTLKEGSISIISND